MNSKEIKTKGKDKKKIKEEKIKEEKIKEEKKKEFTKEIEEEDGDPRAKKRMENAAELKEEAEKKKSLKKLAEQDDLEKFKDVSSNSIKKGMRIDKVAQKREQKVENMSHELREIETVEASGIDDALDALTITKKEEQGYPERHPEKRVKAAYEEWSERRLPELKQEYPNLRLSQYNELLQKEWKKSSENPFNKEIVSYDEKSKKKYEE